MVKYVFGNVGTHKLCDRQTGREYENKFLIDSTANNLVNFDEYETTDREEFFKDIFNCELRLRIEKEFMDKDLMENKINDPLFEFNQRLEIPIVKIDNGKVSTSEVMLKILDDHIVKVAEDDESITYEIEIYRTKYIGEKETESPNVM